MLEGENIVEQALEVARTQAETEKAQAEADIIRAESSIASSEAIANSEPIVSDIVQVAEIEAQRDVAVAEINATTHEEGCCETCRGTESRLTQLENEFRSHAQRMELDLALLREKKEPEVEQVPVTDVKEKRPKEEKKEEEKKPRFGRLFLG